MTIAIISMIRDSWGGSEELWYDMAKEALAKKHKVIHLSYNFKPPHYKLKELISLGLISYTRPGYIKPGSKGISRFTQIVINFFKKKFNISFNKIFSQNPEVVLYNGTCYSIAQEDKLLRKIFLYNGHFFILGHYNDGRIKQLPQHEKEIIKKAYNKGYNIFFSSFHNLSIARRHLGYSIPNAVLTLNPVNMKDKSMILYPENDVAQMALVGNLVMVHKGQDIVLKILSFDKWKQRKWHLNIYGKGNDEKVLKQLVSDYGLEERITFHGKINDIRAVWKENQLLLMPSHMEGMPLAVVEAMLCGRACVVTDIGGMAEWIQEGKSGFIAQIPTVESFENAMERSWNHKYEWAKIGQNAHERSNELYDPSPGKTLLKLITNNLE